MIKISDTEYFSNDKTIRFLNMDCNEFMAQCKENEFDLIHNDPPYGIGASNYSRGGTQYGNSAAICKVYEKKDWDDYAPDNFHFEECIRVSKNQVFWGANHYISKLAIDASCWIVWDKMTAEGSGYADCELAWTSFDKAVRQFRIQWSGMLQYDMKNKEERIHPTQKPIELYKRLLDRFTKPTDTILDCFGGSMSNAIACHMKRRKLTIIELDVDYFKSALNRFEIYERQVEDIKEFGYAKTKISAQNPVLF